MAEFITKITNLSHDQYLALTEAADYGDIQVNVEHIPDTPIGTVKEIFVDKDAETNVYAKLEIKDSVYDKIKDVISGCSVELVYIENENGISIPTACSILLGSEPAIEDAGKTILERVYSKIKNTIGDIIGNTASKDIVEYSESAPLEQLDNIANIDELRGENQKLIDELEKQAAESTDNLLTLYFAWIYDNINNFDEQKLKDFLYSINDPNLPDDRSEIFAILMSYSLQFIDEYNRATAIGIEQDLDKVKENISGDRLKTRILFMEYRAKMYQKAKDLLKEKVVYLTMNDDRVRPEHRKLQGTAFIPEEHPELIPPIDYNCRCFIVPLSDVKVKDTKSASASTNTVKSASIEDTKIKDLQIKYNKGKEMYTALKKDYEELQNKYEELEKAHNKLKEQVVYTSDEENKDKSAVKLSIMDVLTR